MDIGKALTYITEDPRWKEKVAIGTGVVILSTVLSVVLIGLVGFLIVMGYMVRLLKNVRDGAPHPMPEWDQWGDDLVRGLKLVVVVLVWSLPAILFSIPVGLGGALADGRGAGAFIGSTILFGGMCLLILYGLFLAVAQASFTIAFARDEQISSGLRVREIWDWTLANIGQLVIVALAYIVVSIGASLVASIVGTLLCIIGLIVTLPLAQLVIYLFQYHLYGQLAAAYPFSGGGVSEPYIPPPPPPVTPAEGGPGVTEPATSVEDNPYAAYGPQGDEPASAPDIPPADAALEDLPEPTPTEDSVVESSEAAPSAPPASETDVSDEESYPDSGIEEDKPKPPSS